MSKLFALVFGVFFGLLIGCTVGCGGSPTAADYVPPKPSVLVKPADAGLQVIADSWWPKQAACVGVEERVVGLRYPINVNENPFDCDGVLAAGCMRFTSIEVFRRYFEAALSHEYIHLALWKMGGENIGHSNPAFARCDVLNYVAPASVKSKGRIEEKYLTEFGKWLYATDHKE